MAMLPQCLRFELWKDFDGLSDEVQQNVNLAIIFTELSYLANNVIYVTRDDDVFAFGFNFRGCLGIGHAVPVHEPEKIKALCGQNVTDLVFGGKSTPGVSLFAITCFGCVFAWGKNRHGELGLGTNEYTVAVPTKIKGELEHKRVVQIATGLTHSLALTSEGEVYAFGANHSGQLGIDFETKTPAKINSLVGNFVTAVACAHHASVALTDTGLVFVWGDDNGHTRYIPRQMNGLAGIPISKVTCGPDHVYALSRDGQMYVWGNVQLLRIGLNAPNEEWTAHLMQTDRIGRVKDIVVSNVHYHYPIIAVNEEGQAFDWRNPSFVFSCAEGAIVERVLNAGTIEPIRQKFKRVESISTCAGPLFDDQETSDITFIVEGKKIFCHKLILAMRCPAFRKIFNDDCDASSREHVVENHSYETFHAFLKYVYTEEFEVNRHSVLALINLANFYQMSCLVGKCVQFMKSNMTIDTAPSYYETSLTCNTKDLTNFAFKFCHDHRATVFASNAFALASRSVVMDINSRGTQI